MPFALGLSNAGDCVDFCGALFAAYGADLVDAQGKITVSSDEVRQVLEYGQQLVKFLPRDVLSYDSASNNRALISGQSALIFNPPSAWAVAKRDQPQVAQDCWTISAPRGPKGRFVAYNPYFWAIWSFSRNKHPPARKSGWNTCPSASRSKNGPRRYRASTFRRSTACWTSRCGTRSSRRVARCIIIRSVRRITRVRMWPARRPRPISPCRSIAVARSPRCWRSAFTGQSIPQVIAWAEEELEGFSR